MKLPALYFYVGDWRKDTGVQSLSYHDRGVWFELLCFMHESERRGKLIIKGKALHDDSIVRLLGLDKQVGSKTISTLLEAGVADRCPETGALMSRRMVRDEELRKIRQECGKMGGNPKLVKQNRTTKDNHSTEYEIEDEDGSSGSSIGESEGKATVETLARVALHFLNEKAGRAFRETEANLSPIIARLEGVKLDIEGVKLMISRQVDLWKGEAQMDEYLCPATLFRRSNFDKYYDNRNLPILALKKPETHPIKNTTVKSKILPIL